MKSILFFLIPLSFLVSCEEDNIEKQHLSRREIVFAGFYDSTYNHMVFEPDFFVELKQTGCWEMEGSDSIDIDNNGIYDIIFRTGDLNNKPYDECCPQPEDTNLIIDCWPAFFPFYQITVIDSFEILADTIMYGQISSITHFIDTLNLNDTINIRKNWYTNSKLYFYTHNKPPNGGYGYWENIQSVKYLGFRLTKNGIKKHGWIKIEKTDRIRLKELAYKK